MTNNFEKTNNSILSDTAGSASVNTCSSKTRYRAVSLVDLENVCCEKADEVLTFCDLIDRFLIEKNARVRATTLESYIGAIDRFIRPCFGKMQAREITPIQVRAWQNVLMTLSYKPGYLRKINSLLCSIFKYGTRFYGLFTNPAALAGPIVAKKSREEIHFWTPEEYGFFISHVNNVEKRLIFNILYWTGMRIGELMALTPDDIDLSRGTISITKTYRRKGGKDIISPPKTPKSLRIIFINRSLAEDIADYIEMKGPGIRGQRLFTIHPQTLRRSFYKHARMAGLARIKLHDLRHSHASYLINNNFQVLVISDRLGHEQIETTLDTYTHIYPKEPENLALMLEQEYIRLGCSVKMIGKAAGSDSVSNGRSYGYAYPPVNPAYGSSAGQTLPPDNAKGKKASPHTGKNTVSRAGMGATFQPCSASFANSLNPSETDPYSSRAAVDDLNYSADSNISSAVRKTYVPRKAPTPTELSELSDYEILSRAFKVW